MKSIRSLLKEEGRLFSEELGIDVTREPFRWLLAAMLFGGRINETIAKNTYRAFERHRLLTPNAILRAGWGGLIPVMGEGGYVRYDNVKSAYIIDMCRKLVDEYDGKVDNLHARAHDSADLEAKLLAFKGIGRVTLSIFLRELRGVWEKAEPPLTDIELLAARALGFTKARSPITALEDLTVLWEKNQVPGCDFRHLEAALVRKGLELRRKGRR